MRPASSALQEASRTPSLCPSQPTPESPSTWEAQQGPSQACGHGCCSFRTLRSSKDSFSTSSDG